MFLIHDMGKNIQKLSKKVGKAKLKSAKKAIKNKIKTKKKDPPAYGSGFQPTGNID